MVKLQEQDTDHQNPSVVGERISQIGGYKVNLCEPLPRKLQCPFCHLLMRNPLQTCRGELACEDCYKEAISGSGICPIDGEPITSNQFFIDKFKKNEIDLLKCFCINNDFGCSWKGKIGELENHRASCEYVPVKCCVCEEKVSQVTLSTHLDNCPKLSLNGKCIYPECSFKPVNIDDLKDHLRKDVVSHAMLHSSAITNMQMEFKVQLDVQQKNATQRRERLEGEMKGLMEQISLFMTKAKETKEDNEGKISILHERIKELESRPSPSATPSEDSNSASLLQDLSSKVNMMNQNVSDLDLRQQLFENTSYDGKLVWKIDNVSRRLNQAIIGKVTALHSAPTFTSKYGYKFCGRLYLNGDGVGRGTHISMFFVLMKSEYDSLLNWPFNKRITMRLINQNDTKEDIVETFDADVNSSSFAKPKKEMNIASGCPMFITKENLLSGNFIKDDTMFLELSVSN